MSPRHPSAQGRSGFRRFSLCHCVSGVLLTGLVFNALPLAAQTAAQPAALPSAPAAQGTAQQSAPPSTLPNAPGQTTPTPAPKPQTPTPQPSAAPATQQTAPPPQQTSTSPVQPPTPATAPAAQTPASNQEPEQAAPGDEQGTYTLKQNVNEVNLTFTVTDRHGRFVNNLQQHDFALLDDQRAPAQVYSFRQQTNQPLRVGLVIDASTSIRARFKFEQQAATEFLLDILRPRTDRAFIMGFDVTSYVTQGFTNNPDLLETGLNRLKPGGGTALYDAVYRACRDQMLRGVPENAEVRKALILVSDGDDNQSRAYLDDAIKMCQRAETTIYSISTNTSPTRERGDDVLKKMALATGGTALYPQRIEDIANEFHRIEEELRSQYSLAYKPADFRADGSFRTIYLTALRSGYVVHARTGYFAPK
ncbi:MAG TPA: VWA domain-containing protein [Acidobacteriaceae bacterium]